MNEQFVTVGLLSMLYIPPPALPPQQVPTAVFVLNKQFVTVGLLPLVLAIPAPPLDEFPMN